ncbi:MAG TPA: hypothetical protein VHQ65_01750 [Thermoanaerobaculia bacterium]|nr:hypothetical protein [Thermoanaerobaculia bacterium]
MATRLARLSRLLRHQRPVAALAAAAAAREVDAHLVGGVIRDRLLGLPSRDHDAVVGGAGREIGAELAATLDAHLVLLGGKAFAAYRLVARDPEDWVLDLWDREDMPLADDLARRDFTINAMALPLTGPAVSSQGEHSGLIDPFGGLGDTAHRLLRATTPASFTGDPLRVLRLPRLLAQLPRFQAAPDTLVLARRAAPAARCSPSSTCRSAPARSGPPPRARRWTCRPPASPCSSPRLPRPTAHRCLRWSASGTPAT